jgi:hypothetical protein
VQEFAQTPKKSRRHTGLVEEFAWTPEQILRHGGLAEKVAQNVKWSVFVSTYYYTGFF